MYSQAYNVHVQICLHLTEYMYIIMVKVEGQAGCI